MSFIADISAYANPFGLPAKGKWNLSPGTWKDAKSGITTVFFAETKAKDDKGTLTAIDQVSDSGHRRLAVYKYPYLDGQRVKDLGREGETYTFNIKFHGPNYQKKLKEFYDQVYRSNSVGKLQHPVLSAIRGAIDCRLQSFEPVHRADENNSVTFKAVFIEDNTGSIDFAAENNKSDSADTALQRSLKSLVETQALVTGKLAELTAALQIPAAVAAGMNARKTALIGSLSSLIGQLGATFSNKNDLLGILAISANAIGGATDVSSGAVVTRTSTGTSQITKLPPVFQVGLDAQTQKLVESRIDDFVNANQITPQQAVFNANQSRAGLTAAIKEVELNVGNEGYDIVVQYRQLAVTMQETVEACITAAQTKVKIYKLDKAMSLRAVAFANGLSADRQNDIEMLNPYLGSVNYVPKGSLITVPAS